MSHSSDNLSAKMLTSPAALALDQAQSAILSRWVSLVKEKVVGANELRSSIIIDTIPLFMGNLAEALDGRIRRTDANESNNVAEEHGGERARVTQYTPNQIIQEYILLRNLTIEVVSEKHPLNSREHFIIQNSFDEAIQQSVMAFYVVYSEIRESVFSYLAHDMRTPLTSARLSLDLIMRSARKLPEGKQKEDINRLALKAVKGIDYTNDLIEKMLDDKHFQNSSVKLTENLKPAEMSAIVAEAVDGLSLDTQKNLILECEKVDGFWNAKAIRRVVENLVSNAVKYGNEDSPIQVKVKSTHGRVLISVHNKGDPIPLEKKELLFKARGRLEVAIEGQHKGWGLGLAFCRAIAEQHAGSIGVDSSADNGTTFTVDMPVDPRNIEISTVTH